MNTATILAKIISAKIAVIAVRIRLAGTALANRNTLVIANLLIGRSDADTIRSAADRAGGTNLGIPGAAASRTLISDGARI